MIFLAGRDRYTQRTLHRDIHDWLGKQAGCETVRYNPSRRRPRYVLADVDTATFLGTSYAVNDARLEIRFWYPENGEHEYYRINWAEPTRELMIGFHQDNDHPDLGPCHIQLDFEGKTITRHKATFLDDHPLAVLNQRLQEFPAVLDAVIWSEEQPTLPDWPA